MSRFSLIVSSLLLFIVVQLVVSRLASRRADNATFFTAGRNESWYAVLAAMISAAMSGITFVSVPGMVGESAFSYLQMVIGFTVGQLIVAFWLIPLFYRWCYRSIYEYFGARFGVCSHRAGGWFFFLSKLAAVALKLYIVSMVMQVLLFDAVGLPFWVNVLVTVAVVWLSTRRGGVRALLATDRLKSLLMVASVVVIAGVLLDKMGWSLAEGWRELVDSPRSQVLFLADPTSPHYFWKEVVAGVVLLVTMTGLDQDLMQRNLACRTRRGAQLNVVLTALCQAVVIALFLGLGWLLYAYADRSAMALPEKGDSLFPMVAVSETMPWFVTALFVVGFASSSFSAAGSALTALTTSFSIDIMQGNRLSDKDLERLRKRIHLLLAVVLFGVVVLTDCLADASAIDLVYRVAGYTYGPILGLFLFGLWTRCRVHDRWVWVALIVGPVLAATTQWLAAHYADYRIGFELLLYNALYVMAGLWLLRERKLPLKDEIDG